MGNPSHFDEDFDNIETITIVGGGDAGLIAALSFKQTNPSVDVKIIDDFTEDIPTVGKSTISYILHTFHEFLEIDMHEFIPAVKPIWKGSVYFEEWCGCEPFHVPFDAASLQPQEPGRKQFETLYHRYETDNFRTMGGEIAEEALSPFSTDGNFYRQVAYHLGTDRLNEFLRERCRERDIKLVDDEIIRVKTAENHITSIVSDTTAYESDCYVDATGFDRDLMGALDNDFKRYDFPLDSAVVAQTDLQLAEVLPATLIHSGPHGWFWQIDTFDCRDMGYVYSSDHVSDDEAISEFIEEKDEPISSGDIQQYRFESGRYEEAWVNNCLAIGNALGFVEPLQSTALSVNAMLNEKCGQLLSAHHGINHSGVRELYNATVRGLWDNVYDFISIHYRFADGDNQFWRDMRSVNDEATLARYVDNWHDNGFASFDEFGGRAESFSGPDQQGSSLRGFNQYLYYHVLRSLGVDSEFYENVDILVSDDVKAEVDEHDADIERRTAGLLTCEEFYEKASFT